MGLKKSATIKRPRKSVKFDCPPWIRWEELIKIYHKCPSQLHRDIFVTLFLTGGRTSEVIELKPSQVKYNEKLIKIENMVVRKHRKRAVRTFLIDIKDNPLTADFIDFVEGCEYKYLFPQTQPFVGEPMRNKHTSTTRIYYLVRQISDDLFPHWFRGQRASFLVLVKGLDAIKLAKWFSWKSMDMPLWYVNQTMKEQAEDFGYSEKDVPM